MIIKQKFELLKDVPNILSLPSSKIKEIRIDNGPRKVFTVLKLIENKIDHFTKKKIFDNISILEKRKAFEIVYFPEYTLHVSFNKPTKQIVINLFPPPLNSDDIYATSPDPKNIYACMVYASCFSELVNDKFDIPLKYSTPISNFLVSMFVQIFGRDFGLLGAYSSEISKLKFLISTYVLISFFGQEVEKTFRRSAIISGVNLKEIEKDLHEGEYDFKKMFDFIRALSELKVMNGLTKYSFTSKMYQRVGPHFLPALEDLSRFISVMTTTSISGSNITPTFIYQYNREEYMNILEISKQIFK